MKIIKIQRNKEVCHTFDITTESGAFSLPNGCVSHNSSILLNSTNGFEMVKELIISKESKAGVPVQVVPEYHKLKKYYQLLWEQKDCVEYLKTTAVIQAFSDQGMSINTWYNNQHFEGGKIPATLVMKNIMLASYWGHKLMYYDLRNKQAAKQSMDNEVTKALENATQTQEEKDDGFCEGCVL